MVKKLILTLVLSLTVLATAAFAGRVSTSARTKVDPQAAMLMDVTKGTKATAFLRTDEVVYLPGESIVVTLDIDPNGHLFPKTQFMYLWNVQTGSRLYINAVDGILTDGTITDYSGDSVAEADAYPIPTGSDIVIFGDNGQAGPAIAVTSDMIGNHKLVFELRDVTAQRIFQRIEWGFAVVSEVEVLPTSISSDTTLTNDKAYVLNNAATFVEDGATLTIEPGTYVLGTGLGTLVVARGGKLIAEGTVSRPIVMTSANSVGERAPQDWGGLILNGRGPINLPGGIGQGEGDTGEYGGGDTPDPADNSGTLKYVRVEFAGFEFSPDNELNGIAFQGTGSGTTVDFIQVHFNKDDGVEFFGGTTNMKHYLGTANADDSLDWTEGWVGKAQFIVIQQNPNDADQGIEADNKSGNNELTPRSNPTIYNITLIGANPQPDTQDESDIGMLIREGTAATIKNAIIQNFGEQGLVIDHDSTVNQVNSGNVVLTNAIYYMNGTSGEEGKTGNYAVGSNVTVQFDIDAFMAASGLNAEDVDPGLRDPLNLLSPDFRPWLESPALNVNWVADPPDDGFFVPVYYLGGMDPTADWTVGWTTHAPN